MAVRFDNSPSAISPAEKLSDGRLRASAFLTRTGVFTYRSQDGSERREYRPDSEVFDSESMRSFAMAPVTDDHPPVMLTSKNARQYAVGALGENVRRDGDHVASTLTVFDQSFIEKMEGGKQQLSCGYTCDLEMTPGVTANGEKYDAIQKNIRGNHLAIVEAGRAGPTARVRIDSDTSERWDSAEMVPVEQEKGNNMKQELEKALADCAAEKLRADLAEKEINEQKARADKAEAERDALQVAVDGVEKARADAANALPEIIRARVSLETKALMILGSDVRLDGLADRAIKAAVVKKVDGVEIASDKSDDYVAARFDSALERHGNAEKANANLRSVADGPRADVSPAEVARMEMMKRNAEAAKG